MKVHSGDISRNRIISWKHSQHSSQRFEYVSLLSTFGSKMLTPEHKGTQTTLVGDPVTMAYKEVDFFYHHHYWLCN
jgi:hypothetical protein